jgi:hypothetical protein
VSLLLCVSISVTATPEDIRWAARREPLAPVRISRIIHAIPEVPASSGDRHSGVFLDVEDGTR